MSIVKLPALAALSVLALAFPGGVTPTQAQSPVQKEQTPTQAEQSRDQDRSRAENTKIGRDWKAEGGDRANTGSADPGRSDETVGRDWRAHPKAQDR